MQDAPEDGTWIIGKNKEGREARIQSRAFHPKMPGMRQWFQDEPQSEGHWTRNICFYPIAWRPA